MSWDVFISHASEDKDEVVRPLAERLRLSGIRVWLDEQELNLGDSLRGKIDAGLGQSRWGVVILSPSFLQKRWPQAELDALMTREMSGEKVLLPVWHNVTATDIVKFSPLLATKLAVSTDQGLAAVCKAIIVAMQGGSNEALASHSLDKRSFQDAWFASLGKEVEYPDMDLGHFQIHQVVGHGGSGVVFRAFHTPLGKTVALKVLFPIRETEHQITRMTERAVRGLATLSHRNLLSPEDFGYLRKDGLVSVFIVTAFVDGVDLTTWSASIATDRNALRRRIEMALQLADAMSVAHNCRFVGDLGFEQTGILHGDLKPANILVEARNDRPAILDFMIPDLHRLACQPEPTFWRKRQNGQYSWELPATHAFGTPGFMPPEQSVDGVVSRVSDVYSLGVTFGYLFWPNSEDGRPSYLTQLTMRYGWDLPDVDANESAVLQLLESMVQPNPADRPQSMDVVVRALSAILARL